MPNLDAPARLAFWPERPWDQGSDYDTLRQALAEAAQHPAETPWIVTLSGKILKPREVADLISTLRDEGKSDPLLPLAEDAFSNGDQNPVHCEVQSWNARSRYPRLRSSPNRSGCGFGFPTPRN